MIYLVGLGNPTDQYSETRHNVGRDILELFRKAHKFEEWGDDKKLRALTSEGKIGKEKVMLIMPETFMNDSGKSLKPLITNKKKAKNTIVVYDELDLGIGTVKISFNKNSGGHKGIESTIKQIKTKEFARLRIGISPVTPTGKIKKPSGNEKVKKHVLSKFSPKEEVVMKKVFKNSVKALTLVVQKGYMDAMGEVNSWR